MIQTDQDNPWPGPEGDSGDGEHRVYVSVLKEEWERVEEQLKVARKALEKIYVSGSPEDDFWQIALEALHKIEVME